jgi:hypothetical protein
MSTNSAHQVIKLNPALKDLDSLVGKWKIAGSHPMLPAPVRGQASFEWLEDGAFLAWRTTFERPGPPSATAVIGRDEALAAYRILYSDERGVSRIYEMSFADSQWTFWRNSPGFSQRMTFTISHDGNTLTGHGEKTTDGKIWEDDLDVTYTRIAQV